MNHPPLCAPPSACWSLWLEMDSMDDPTPAHLVLVIKIKILLCC